MPTITHSATSTVAVSADQAWTLLSDGFLDVSTWAGGVNASGPNPNTPTGYNGSPVGGRVCDVDGIGTTDERIIDWDDNPTSRRLAYSVSAKKIPFFVDRMTSSWQVEPKGDQAEVTLTVEAVTKGLVGYIGQFPLKKMVNGAAPGLLGDFQKHLES